MPLKQKAKADPSVPRHTLKDIGILPTAINSLFQRDNFRNCALSTPNLNWSNIPTKLNTRSRIKKPHYKRMMPALQLASRLVEKAMPFYCKILCALRFNGSPLLAQDFLPNDKKISVTIYMLQRLSRVLRIFRSDSKADDAICRAQCVNMARHFLDPEQAKLYSCPERPAVALILSAEVFDFWTMPDQLWKETPVFNKQMYSFELAVNLVHEIAHAIWDLRMLSDHFLIASAGEPQIRRLTRGTSFLEYTRPEQISKAFQEPLCSPYDPERELGWACEQYVLGMITWGMYWPSEEEKTGENATNARRVGKPAMYFAPWLLNSCEEGKVESSSKDEQSSSVRPTRITQASKEDSWEEFIANHPGKVIPVDEKYLATVFKKRPMRQK